MIWYCGVCQYEARDLFTGGGSGLTSCPKCGHISWSTIPGLPGIPFRKAVEANARERLLADLRAKIEALPRWDKRTVPGGFHVKLADVLALLSDHP